MSDFATSAVSLIGLRATGVTVAIDDYGTGRSSLAYLKELSIDMLKIDGSFVGGLGKSDEDASIVAAIIAMAHALGLTTVAEGVETAKQLMSLRALGCDFAQGYLWAGALHPDELHAPRPRRIRDSSCTRDASYAADGSVVVAVQLHDDSVDIRRHEGHEVQQPGAERTHGGAPARRVLRDGSFEPLEHARVAGPLSLPVALSTSGPHASCSARPRPS